ncbi:MAG: D-serine ammonia-lyase [Clostridia bacterium]|nr:D-serine ammonia-lyase [Clostridia bacterium]
MKEIMNRILKKEPVFYKNPAALDDPSGYLGKLDIGFDDIVDAEQRLGRFAPLVSMLFPETKDGIIESPFIKADNFREKVYPGMKGGLYFKLDSHLEVAGSIKARGGIYEVLKVTEDILIRNNLLDYNDDYSVIAGDSIRKFLSGFTVSVASTGNLGLSIGIMAAKLGYNSRVHMSRDAKQWKKDRLTAGGVTMVEHDGDFTYAAAMGRREAGTGNNIHFVDDERSCNLFLGYAVSALRIKGDLKKHGIEPTREKPLVLYLPCGVGGAPGGIAFGFKHAFGERVKCYLAEPVSSPSMLLGVMTGRFGQLNVNDYGLDNKTELDGLAVASPSDFVSPMMEFLCDGFFTVRDEKMFEYLYLLKETEGIGIEPSAAAGIPGPGITGLWDRDVFHIVWTTGGLFVPGDIYDKMYFRGKRAYEDSRD